MLSSLVVLLSLPGHAPPTPSMLHLQVAHGVTEVMRTHASTLTTSHQWKAMFSLLDFVGTRVSDRKEGVASSVFGYGRSLSKEEADGGLHGSSVVSESLSADDLEQDIEGVDGLSSSFVLLDVKSLERHDPQVSRAISMQ